VRESPVPCSRRNRRAYRRGLREGFGNCLTGEYARAFNSATAECGHQQATHPALCGRVHSNQLQRIQTKDSRDATGALGGSGMNRPTLLIRSLNLLPAKGRICREVGRDGCWHWRKLDQIEAAKARDVGQPGENRTRNLYAGGPSAVDGAFRRGEGGPYAERRPGPCSRIASDRENAPGAIMIPSATVFRIYSRNAELRRVAKGWKSS
jgi:hypothetical protein